MQRRSGGRREEAWSRGRKVMVEDRCGERECLGWLLVQRLVLVLARKRPSSTSTSLRRGRALGRPTATRHNTRLSPPARRCTAQEKGTAAAAPAAGTPQLPAACGSSASLHSPRRAADSRAVRPRRTPSAPGLRRPDAPSPGQIKCRATAAIPTSLFWLCALGLLRARLGLTLSFWNAPRTCEPSPGPRHQHAHRRQTGPWLRQHHCPRSASAHGYLEFNYSQVYE